MSIGDVIRDRRHSKGLTLVELAKESGVSNSYLGRVEQGNRFPSARILKKLFAPLSFTETELLKLAGYMSRDGTDDRLEKFKSEIKLEITTTLSSLLKKIDSL